MDLKWFFFPYNYDYLNWNWYHTFKISLTIDVEVHDFTEHTGPVFPDGFNVETASPKDYFNLVPNT
jgi:hypothetical protein